MWLQKKKKARILEIKHRETKLNMTEQMAAHL